MNVYELKEKLDARGSKYFNRESMKFFGDKMSNYGVETAIIESWSGDMVECWELYRKKPVKHGNQGSAFFCKETFEKRSGPTK